MPRRARGRPSAATAAAVERERARTAVAAVLSAMDYDVYLYTDADTGEDAVVYRSGPIAQNAESGGGLAGSPQ